MSDDHQVPPGIDPTVPSVARGYDFLLGGKDNYEIDRQVAGMLMSVAPEAPLAARANKEFGRRVVQFLAEQGIRQFVDLGSGIPTTPPAVHDVARSIQPAARVVYVDVDPVVVAHSHALRSATEGLTTILADIRRPGEVLDRPELRALIDFDEPVAVLIFSVLDVVPEEDDPYGIVATVRDQLAPESYLAISHMSARSTPEVIAKAHQISEETGFPRTAFKPDEEVARFFEGFELVPPGLVEITEWRPDQQGVENKIRLVGGAGRRS